MKRVTQTILNPPTGNCLAACVASLLERPLWTVPNFGAASETGDWFGKLGEFMAENGRATILLPCRYQDGASWPTDDGAGALCPSTVIGGWALAMASVKGLGLGILTIESQRGPYNHCVVADLATGRVRHDPFPGAVPGDYAYRPIYWMIFPRLGRL